MLVALSNAKPDGATTTKYLRTTKNSSCNSQKFLDFQSNSENEHMLTYVIDYTLHDGDVTFS